MPRLWTDTIAAHRRNVRDAILDATSALVAEHGLLSVTMARIAEDTGIGRATLYKYFPDVESVLLAWHGRQIAAHLDRLVDVRDQQADVAQRVPAVFEAYAFVVHESHGHHDADLAAFLHRDERLVDARRQLQELVEELLADGVRAGEIRGDVSPRELSTYSLHALAAAADLPSKAAVRRLVSVTLAGLRPPR